MPSQRPPTHTHTLALYDGHTQWHNRPTSKGLLLAMWHDKPVSLPWSAFSHYGRRSETSSGPETFALKLSMYFLSSFWASRLTISLQDSKPAAAWTRTDNHHKRLQRSGSKAWSHTCLMDHTHPVTREPFIINWCCSYLLRDIRWIELTKCMCVCVCISSEYLISMFTSV